MKSQHILLLQYVALTTVAVLLLLLATFLATKAESDREYPSAKVYCKYGVEECLLPTE